MIKRLIIVFFVLIAAILAVTVSLAGALVCAVIGIVVRFLVCGVIGAFAGPAVRLKRFHFKFRRMGHRYRQGGFQL